MKKKFYTVIVQKNDSGEKMHFTGVDSVTRRTHDYVVKVGECETIIPSIDVHHIVKYPEV